MDEILDYWKNANHCVDEPVIDTFPNLHNDGLRFVRYSYEGDAELQHIKVIGGNHTWYHNANQYDISYLTEIHRFFTEDNNGNVGVEEPVVQVLRLWPNPATWHCSIGLEANTNVEIFDLQSRLMASFPLKKGVSQFDVSGLPEGLYFIKTAEGTVGKIIIRK